MLVCGLKQRWQGKQVASWGPGASEGGICIALDDHLALRVAAPNAPAQVYFSCDGVRYTFSQAGNETCPNWDSNGPWGDKAGPQARRPQRKGFAPDKRPHEQRLSDITKATDGLVSKAALEKTFTVEAPPPPPPKKITKKKVEEPAPDLSEEEMTRLADLRAQMRAIVNGLGGT